MSAPDKILGFWLDEIDREQWYMGDEKFDAICRERFEESWHKAMDGGFGHWLTYPNGCLAYILLTDQLSRNIFRGTAQAFASDRNARAVAKQAIKNGWDQRVDEPARQFFYMPLMHSENLCDQEHCIRLIKQRMPETGDANLLHARAHREVIRLFGRFPYRNEVLKRKSTAPEKAYLAQGGYGYTLQSLDRAVA